MINEVCILHYNRIKGMHFLWFKTINHLRWIYWEWNGDCWWIPKIEKYRYGIRIGWLKGAIGTGIVTE